MAQKIGIKSTNTGIIRMLIIKRKYYYYKASKDKNAAKQWEEASLHEATLKYIRDNNIVLPMPNA